MIDASYGTETHDNYVEFFGTVISYNWTAWTITEGQPMETVRFSGDMLDVVAGRKESSLPAAYFSQGLNVVNMLGLNEPISTVPSELNFVINGGMTFEFPNGNVYWCDDFRIA